MRGKPAQVQSEAWVGAQPAEQMAQYSKSALRIFQEMIKVTARVLGISDKKALSGFIKGKWPLLEVGAVAGAGVGLAAAGTDALLADQKEYAAGGPVYASEILHMQGGEEVLRPPIITLPAPFEQLRNLEIRHKPVPQFRPSVKGFPDDPPPPQIGSPIIEESISAPVGPARLTGFRTRVPERAVGTTPSGAVMRDSEELGVRVEGLPVARVGPVSVALNIDLFKTKEGISGPGIKHTIGSQLKRFGIIGQGEDFRLHFDRTTTDVKGGPSETEHSGSLVVNVLRDEKFGTADVYVNANELEGKLEGSVGIRGGFKFAEGGLASMAPEARGMFGKPHPMVKEPRLTDLGPGTNPGVASLCGVARNMNRSVVA